MSKKIDEATLSILSMVTVDGDMVFLTCGLLNRRQYLSVNEILANIGGKWNKKTKAHVFDGNPTERLEAVLLSGEITPPKKYGYFPTPPDIAQMVIDMACIESGDRVLEPSAGQGAIAEKIPTPKNRIVCYEVLPDNVLVLRGKGFEVNQFDFLQVAPAPIYDRVTMNPPFSYEGFPQAEIDHVKHALKFLKPGGILVSVMSTGITFRQNKKTVEFRDFVNGHGEIMPLPEGSFKESGANVNTVIVKIRKP